MATTTLQHCRSSLVEMVRMAAEFDQFGMTAASHGVRVVAEKLRQAIVEDERELAETG